MKLAITSQSSKPESPVDPRFGRAKWFMLYDTDTGRFEPLDNVQNLNAMQGAGIQAAETISRYGVEYLLTGHCGPNAFRTLKAAGIRVIVGVEGTVKEVVEKFKKGELKAVEKPDVSGHWV